MTIIADRGIIPTDYCGCGYITTGMELNTAGHTDFGTFCCEDTAAFFLGEFNERISDSIDPYIDFKLSGHFGSITFKRVKCSFHTHQIKIVSRYDFTGSGDYRAETEAAIRQYTDDVFIRVNRALDDLEIRFPEGRLYFGHANKWLSPERFWIPVEKNEPLHRVSWYKIKATRPCYLEETIRELTKVKKRCFMPSVPFWDDDPKDLAAKWGVDWPEKGGGI